MSWLQKLIDLIYKDGEFIWDNIYIFVTFGVVLVGLTLAINKVLNNRLNRKYQEARDKIEDLKQENKTLSAENQALREIYNKYDEIPRLMMGTNENFSCPSAEAISNKINRKDSMKKKIDSFVKSIFDKKQ